MGLLGRAEILSTPDLKSERVFVQDWGGEVIVRSFTGHDRERFEDLSRGMCADNIRALLVSLTLVDDRGALLFSQDDVAALGEKSSAALEHVFTVALRLNAIGKGDVELLVGNSGPGQNGSTTSSLPSVSA